MSRREPRPRMRRPRNSRSGSLGLSSDTYISVRNGSRQGLFEICKNAAQTPHWQRPCRLMALGQYRVWVYGITVGVEVPPVRAEIICHKVSYLHLLVPCC